MRRIDYVTPTNRGRKEASRRWTLSHDAGRRSDHVKKRMSGCFSTVVYRQMLHRGGLALWARARMAHRETTVKDGVKSFPLRAEQEVSMESRRIKESACAPSSTA